jgi:hypothetical protein
MLPEELELVRLEAEQAKLKEQVTSAELALQTTKAETARFQHRYYRAVGRLYAELDELDAQIAKAQAGQAPDDTLLKSRAETARCKADKSAEEAGVIEAQPTPPRVISPELKKAYRQAVKLVHPDLAFTEHERQRRTKLMALVNLAHERSDQKAIEKLIEEFGQDPEAIVGEDVASRIVKAIRRIAQLRRRLSELHQELDVFQKNETFQLRQTVLQAEANSEDPLGDLARQLERQIAGRNELLAVFTATKGARSRI